MASRLFAVHDHNRETVRLEAASDSLPNTEVFLGVRAASILRSENTQGTPEMFVAQADATGRINLVPTSLRPVGEPKGEAIEPTDEDVVLQTDRGQRTARDSNLFLNYRIAAVLPRIRGRLLDVGCGVNELVKRYGSGTGVQRLSEIPEQEKFDTVTLMAVLNYVPDSDIKPLLEGCYKRLEKFGRFIVTCVSPFGSSLVRMIWNKSPGGLREIEVKTLVENAGFKLVYSRPFMFGLNRVYVFGKEEKEIPVVKHEVYH